MTATTERTVIVGGSVGGVRTAQALRAEGYQGDLLMIEDEQEVPYDKPPLSKDLLAGRSSSDDIRLLTRSAADELGVELLLGARACGLSGDGRLRLTGREPMPYDRLVVATGSRATPSPWGTRPGIHLLRTVAEAQALREEIDAGGPIAVIGGGFIGAEVAATASERGVDVILVDPLPTPLGRALEPDIGRTLIDLHTAHGVDCRFGVGVTAIEGSRGDFLIRLQDGGAVMAAAILVGIGASPNTSWLEGSGLTVSDGLVCDEWLRSIDDPSVYAVGDVARWHNPGTGELDRLEHWTNAVDQAACVAHNITHPERARGYVPSAYVWTDQYDWKIQMVGQTVGAPVRQLSGDVDSGRFAVAYGDAGGSFVGAVIANWPRALITARKALAAKAAFSEAAEALSMVARPQRITV